MVLQSLYVRMSKTSPCTPMSVSNSVFCVGRTQWVVLSAATTQNRVKKLIMVHFFDASAASSDGDGRRRHAGCIASELRKHPPNMG